MEPQEMKGRGWLTRFVEEGVPFAVTSTYCTAARYDIKAGALYIGYGDGSVWRYGDISPGEARAFATAPSKGKWMWDNVRVRGTKDEHQKPARRVA